MSMSDAPNEIELHPAVGECLTRLRADLAASESRCDFLRATAREYLAAEARVSLTDARDAAAMHAARTRNDSPPHVASTRSTRGTSTPPLSETRRASGVRWRTSLGAPSTPTQGP